MRDRPVPKPELVGLGLAIGASMDTRLLSLRESVTAHVKTLGELRAHAGALERALAHYEHLTCRQPEGGPCTCEAAPRADLTGYGDDG